MKTRNTYKAVFSDGSTITSVTPRTFEVAWRATWTAPNGKQRVEAGFSVTRAGSQPYAPIKRAGTKMTKQQRTKLREYNEAFLKACGYQIEYVEAVHCG